MKRTSFLAAMAAALILTWGGAAEAQEPALDLSGGYGLEGRSRFGGEVVRTNLRLGRRPTGLYHVLRTSYGEDGERLPVLQGSGRQVGDGMVFVTFDAPEGALQKLWQVISGAERPELESYHGLYVFRDGRVVGTLQAPNADGRRRIYEERGTWDRPAPALEASAAPAAETAPSAPGLPALSGQGLIEQPYDGDAHLAGSELPLVAAPGAHVAVEGPAERTDRGLRLTGPGQVWLRARGPDGARHTVRIASVAPELVGLQVVDALPVDGAEPGFERELGGATPAVAAVLKVGRPLRLAVRLAAPRSLSSPATVVLAARAGERTLLEQEVRLADLAAGAGQVVRLSGAAPFAEAIGAHGLEVRWTLGEREVAVTPLRLYVALGAPAGEPPTPDLPGARPHRDELHYAAACAAAEGAATPEEAAVLVIERLAHYAPGALVAPYEAAPPANAERLGRSSLRIFNPGYDDQADASYADYARNYGWYVLDNPTHPGGRTNQRASLYAAALSLLGVPAQELYVHRWGYGPRTGRLVRRYYQLSSGGQAFNHHTLVQVRLPSGERCYDPYQPEAIQGAFEELVAPGGKVIGAWLGWRYADTQSPVPADDVPAEYVAAGRIGYGQWTGVPLAPGEPAAPEAEAVVVEVRRSDTGARSATFEVRVRSSRGRAAELGQLFVPHAAAVAGSGVTGGALTARVPDWARVEAEHLDLRLPADPRLARLLVEALRPRFAPTPRTDPLEERAIRLR